MVSTRKIQQRNKVLRMIRSGVSAPHISEVVDSLIAAWGGKDRFASSYYETFKQSKPGSMVRARMLEAVLRLMEMLSSRHGRGEDIGLLETEDLEKAAIELLGVENDGQGST